MGGNEWGWGYLAWLLWRGEVGVSTHQIDDSHIEMVVRCGCPRKNGVAPGQPAAWKSINIKHK